MKPFIAIALGAIVYVLLLWGLHDAGLLDGDARDMQAIVAAKGGTL